MNGKVLHKRSLIIGVEPTTSSLDVGEIGINVADGKVFIHKSGSLGESIETVVTTNSNTIGNLIITGNIHASTFSGNGSNLIFTTLNTSQSSDSLLIVGNIHNDYEHKQTTEFRNGDVIVSGSVTIANDGFLILNPINTPPTPVSGGIYFSNEGNFFVGF